MKQKTKQCDNADDLVYHVDHEVLWAVCNRVLSYSSVIMAHGNEEHRYHKPTDQALMRAIKLMKWNEQHYRGNNKRYLDPDLIKPTDCDDLMARSRGLPRH